VHVIPIKKCINAVKQILQGAMLVPAGRATWCWCQIYGDWLGDPRRRRFLVATIAEIDIHEIWVVLNGQKFPLDCSPQRRFFDQLDSGVDVLQTEYAQLISRVYAPEEYRRILSRQLGLYRQFTEPCSRNLPIVSISTGGRFVVEDGAHRLSLMASRGQKKFRVGVSYWAVIPREGVTSR
jgi:hypothetical protein